MLRFLASCVVVLAATVLAIQCGDTVIGPDYSSIVGSWNWVRSCGGYAGNCRYPGSTYPAQVLQFSGNLRYDWSVGDSYYEHGSYRVEMKDVGHGSKALVVILDSLTMPDFPYKIIDYVGRDSLVLTDPCCDGFTSLYYRLLPI